MARRIAHVEKFGYGVQESMLWIGPYFKKRSQNKMRHVKFSDTPLSYLLSHVNLRVRIIICKFLFRAILFFSKSAWWMQMQFAETSDSFVARKFSRFSTRRPSAWQKLALPMHNPATRRIDASERSHFPATRVCELNRGKSERISEILIVTEV